MPSLNRSHLTLACLTVVLLAAVTRVAADDADDQFAVAAGHYDRQRWKLAAEEFQAFLKSHPNDPRAAEGVFFLGESLLQLGKYDDARQRFQDYATRAPAGKYARPALFRAGEAAYLAGKLDVAKTDLDRFAAKYPDDKLNAFAAPYLGEIAWSKGDATAAATLFRDALQRFPDGRLQDDCRVGLAKALEKQNQAEEAERLYLAVAGKTGSRLADAAQFHLGALQYAGGKYDQAVETFSAFENRLAGSPWCSSARLGHGWALLKLNRPDDALKMFEAAASEPKLGVEARYWFGLAQKVKKDWAAAARTLLALAEANPTHELTPAIRFHAGDALLNAGDAAAALKQFDAVLAFNAANGLPDAGGVAGKKKQFDAVLASKAGDEWRQQAVCGKVQAALQTKDYAAVDREAADFEKRFPNSLASRRDVQRMLARSLVERKEFDRAAAMLEPMVDPTKRGQQDLENRYLLGGELRRVETLRRRVGRAAAGGRSGRRAAEDRCPTDAGLAAAGAEEVCRGHRPAGSVPGRKARGRCRPSKAVGELAICYARTGQTRQGRKRSMPSLSRSIPSIR